jgi:hypothetical protein
MSNKCQVLETNIYFCFGLITEWYGGQYVFK